MLFATEQVSRAANFQIQCSEPKSGAKIGKFAKCGKTSSCNWSQLSFGWNQEIGIRASVGTSHAAPQLIKLRESKPVRTVHNQRIDQRDVDSIFDDGGRNKHIIFMMNELHH